MEEKHGIEGIKHIIRVLVGFGEATEAAFEDHKFQLTDVLKYASAAQALFPALRALPTLQKEIEDLSEEERLELNKFLNDELDLSDDELENNIETFIELASDFYALCAKLVSRIGELRSQKKE